MGQNPDSVEWAEAQAAYFASLAVDSRQQAESMTGYGRECGLKNAQYYGTWAETYSALASGPVRLIVEVWDKAHAGVEKRYLLETRFTWPEAVRFAQVADTYDIRHYAVPDGVAVQRLAERERDLPSRRPRSERS